MMWSHMFFKLIFSWMIINNIDGLSSPISPFTNYTYAIELLADTVDLWWTVNNFTTEITFELHMKTTGWIALGISPAGGIPGTDLGVGWVNASGNLIFQDQYASNYTTLMIDSTTTDWFGIQGREQDGWTAIQFKRLIDTCDSMDVPIKSGSNILIFAWGLVDPGLNGSDGDITFQQDRVGSRVVPLLSYSMPPPEGKFYGLDNFQFTVNNYAIPTNKSTYYCQVFKIPNDYQEKRHVIARKININANNTDLVYHLTLNECDTAAVFDDDNNLPSGPCDDNVTAYQLCSFNIILAWGQGGDYLLEFPEEAGLPIGLNTSIKYYMLQINYYNANEDDGIVDNSGIQLYVGDTLRMNDIGALTFGVESLPAGIAIPPQVNGFSVDSYCTATAGLNNIPASGITVFSFFGHTHLTGESVWTKVISNATAVEYLFDAEVYYASYQFEHRLAMPVQVYPGDEFATRCVYNTMNRTEATLGGRLPTEEMCVQVFTYYPRMSNLYSCASEISPLAWQALFNSSTMINDTTLTQYLLYANWTSDLATDWQTFYNTASRLTAFGSAGNYTVSFLPSLPTYTDLNTTECGNQQANSSVTDTVTTTMGVVNPTALITETEPPMMEDSTTMEPTMIEDITTMEPTMMEDTTTMMVATTPMMVTTTTMMVVTATMMVTTTTMMVATTTMMVRTTTAAATIMATTTIPMTNTTSISKNLVVDQGTFILLLFISFLMYGIII